MVDSANDHGDWGGILVASAGTDGIDGPTKAAGAMALGDTVRRARERGRGGGTMTCPVRPMVLTVVFLSWHAAAAGQEVLVQVERFVALSEAYHVLFSAGRHDEAEEKGKEALAIARETLGQDRLYEVIALDDDGASEYLIRTGFLLNIDNVRREMLRYYHSRLRELIGEIDELCQQGRFAAVKQVENRLLALVRKELDPDEPDLVVEYLTQLAYIYQKSGNNTELESLYREILTIHRRQLGPGHNKVGTFLSYLAELYQSQGRHHAAALLLRRALEIYVTNEGPDHHEVHTLQHRLAKARLAQIPHDDEEALFQHELSIKEEIFGPGHAEVAYVLERLANLYRSQNRYAEAERIYERAYDIYEDNFGKSDYQARHVQEKLVGLYQAQDNATAAERQYEKMLHGREDASGAELEHEVQELVAELAELYRSQRRYGEAEALLGHWLGIFQGEFGPDSLKTVGLTTELAVLGYLREDLAQAEEYYMRALSICKTEPAHHVPPSLGVQVRFLQVMRRYWGLDAPGRPGRQQDLEKVRGLLSWQLETTSKVFPPDHEAVVFIRKRLDAVGGDDTPEAQITDPVERENVEGRLRLPQLVGIRQAPERDHVSGIDALARFLAAGMVDQDPADGRGYDADFVMLSENILDSDFKPATLSQVKVTLTVFNGHVLHKDFSGKEKTLDMFQ
ncbi:MAG: tetratricopeptide repeat protein [bacterium]|nr:tetratricopeptide repeat protein [bacterium]